MRAVSYTHLDVYKRQILVSPRSNCDKKPMERPVCSLRYFNVYFFSVRSSLMRNPMTALLFTLDAPFLFISVSMIKDLQEKINSRDMNFIKSQKVFYERSN